MKHSHSEKSCAVKMNRLSAAGCDDIVSFGQWRRQPFKSGWDFRAVKARDTSGGYNLESLKYNFLHFQGKIIQNSKDYKVNKTHDFFMTIRILYKTYKCSITS